MIDIWVKFVSAQFELALNLTRAFFGLGVREEPAPVRKDDPEISGSSAGESQERPVEGQTTAAQDGAATISDIISFLESADREATAQEIAEHLEMDKRIVLPLLKTLVKERRIDELLGKYYLKGN
jgi:hypothetical protein